MSRQGSARIRAPGTTPAVDIPRHAPIGPGCAACPSPTIVVAPACRQGTRRSGTDSGGTQASSLSASADAASDVGVGLPANKAAWFACQRSLDAVASRCFIASSALDDGRCPGLPLLIVHVADRRRRGPTVNRRPILTPNRRPKLTRLLKGGDGSARPGGAGRGCAAGASAGWRGTVVWRSRRGS